MCLRQPRIPRNTQPQVAAYDGREATEQADIEARLRRRRAGVAADILTGPSGIPATRTMGGVA